jgi:hypothetical protein
MYSFNESLKKKIIGAKLRGVSRTAEDSLRIETDRGNIRVSVSGDCCSTSIFYDYIVPEECYGAEIIDFDDWYRDGKVPDKAYVNKKAEEVCGGEDHWFSDCLSIWDVIFKTKNGDALLRHVNSSNGYYDGVVSISCDFDFKEPVDEQ